MKKLFIFSLLTLFFSLSFVSDAEAQRRGKKKSNKTDEYFDESGNFLSKLWYGGGINLNFGTSFLAGYRGNTFLIGVSPMVGYKITPELSVGPRVEILYQSSKYDVGAPDDLKFNSTDFGYGVFARYKFPGYIFGHVEYQHLSEEVGTGIVGTEVQTVRRGVDNFFVGAGYNSGGVVGIETYILWNTSEEFNSNNIPLYYRFGITYKF